MAKQMQVEIYGTREQLDDVLGELNGDGYVVIGAGRPDGPPLDLVLREVEDEEDTGGATYSLQEVEAD